MAKKGELKQFCINGHDKHITGRDSLGRCKPCENKRHRDRYANNIEELRIQSRERGRLDRLCLKEALNKENLKIQKELFYLVVLVSMYGRIAQ